MKIALAVLGSVAAAAGVLGFAADRATWRNVEQAPLPIIGASLSAPGGSVGLGAVVSERGEVVTVAHVVRGCSVIRVARRGDADVGAAAVAFDTRNDLALLKTGLVAVAPVRFAAALRGAARDSVYFAGMEGRPGAIPARIPLHRARIAALYGPNRDVRMFTFVSGWSSEAPIVQPGDSGGPVFDAAGNMVGIVAGRPALTSPAADSVLRRTAFALNAGLVRLFLAAHDVAAPPHSAPRRSAAAREDRAARSTVRVWCVRDGGSGAGSPPDRPRRTVGRASNGRF